MEIIAADRSEGEFEVLNRLEDGVAFGVKKGILYGLFEGALLQFGDIV